MADTKDKDDTPAEAVPEKKGKLGKILMLAGGLIMLVGGGVGAGLYAASSGMLGGKAAAAAPDAPKLVPRSQEKRAAAGASGGEGEAGASHGGLPTPAGSGGERYASNYYTLDKDFTSNMKESVHFIQVGIAVSTPYDDKVIDNLKTHEIAVRSAILMTLGDTDEQSVFSDQGKIALQKRLAAAINATLKQKEGFGGISNVYFTNFVVQ